MAGIIAAGLTSIAPALSVNKAPVAPLSHNVGMYRAARQQEMDFETASRWPSSSLDGLTVAELYILRQRGYVEGATFTLDEIAVLLGCTRERVRKVEQSAMAVLARQPALQDAWQGLHGSDDEALAVA